MGRRLSRLSEAANDALATAAVLGPEFDFDLLQAVAGLEEDALFGALDEAVRARLVIEAPGPNLRHRFAHSLVRATLYDEIPAPRRTRVHRRAGEAIELMYGTSLDVHLPALAHHFGRAAAAGEADKAVAYATQAGDRALAQLAHDEAVTYYLQALSVLDAAGAAPDDVRRIDAAIGLGEAQRRAGDPLHRQTLLGAARLAHERGDAQRLARAALANNRGVLFSVVGAVDEERRAALESALAAVEPGDPALRARLLANLALELVFSRDPVRRQRLSDEALDLSRQSGDDLTRAEVLLARYYTIWSPATLGERRSNIEELEALARRLGDPVRMAQALLLGYRVAIESGDVDRADHCLGEAEQLSAQLGQPTIRWMWLWLRGGRLLMAGSFADAERASKEGARLGEILGQPDAAAFRFTFRLQVAFEQGRLAGFKSTYGISQLVAQNSVGMTGSVAHYLGLLNTTLMRFEQADRRFEAAAATHTRIGAPTWLARTRLEWARMLLTRHQPGDVERARLLLGQALGTARRLGLGTVERRALALLQPSL